MTSEIPVTNKTLEVVLENAGFRTNIKSTKALSQIQIKITTENTEVSFDFNEKDIKEDISSKSSMITLEDTKIDEEEKLFSEDKNLLSNNKTLSDNDISSGDEKSISNNDNKDVLTNIGSPFDAKIPFNSRTTFKIGDPIIVTISR